LLDKPWWEEVVFSGRFWGKGTGFFVWLMGRFSMEICDTPTLWDLTCLPLPQGGGKDEEFSGLFRPQKDSKNPPTSKRSIFRGEKC